MGIGVGAAMLLSTFASTAASSISSSKQRSDAKKAEDERIAASDEAQAESDRIAAETRPEGEGVQAIEFGTGDDAEIGNVSEFIRPRTASSLGSTTGSGLGGFQIWDT